MQYPPTIPWQCQLGHEKPAFRQNTSSSMIDSTILFIVVLVMYGQKPSIRKHFSFMMLQLFIVSLINGFSSGILVTTFELFGFSGSYPFEICTLHALVLHFSQEYIFVLLSALCIERLLMVLYPHYPHDKMKRRLIQATILMIFGTWVLVIVPLLIHPVYHGDTVKPNCTSSDATWCDSAAERALDYRDPIHTGHSCSDEWIFYHNSVTPIIVFILGTLCFCTVAIVYGWLLRIANQRIR